MGTLQLATFINLESSHINLNKYYLTNLITAVNMITKLLLRGIERVIVIDY